MRCSIRVSSWSDFVLFIVHKWHLHFAAEGCVSSMYANNVIIYTCAMSTHELECKLQSCIDSVSNHYDSNKLCNKKKTYSVTTINFETPDYTWKGRLLPMYDNIQPGSHSSWKIIEIRICFKIMTKIIEFHERFLKCVKIKKSWKNHWNLDQ